jgi:hypothetical protein
MTRRMPRRHRRSVMLLSLLFLLASTATLHAAPRTLTLTVVGENGKPLPGISIRLIGRGAPVKRLTTDGQGKLSITAEAAPLKVDGQVLDRTPILEGFVRIDSKKTEATLVLKPLGPNDLICTILGTDGKPLAEAEASAYYATSFKGSGRSGPTGVAVLRNCLNLKNDFIYARHKESNLAAIVPIDFPEDGMTITLAKAAKVTGRVADATGKPVRAPFLSFGYLLKGKVICTIPLQPTDTDSYAGRCLPPGAYRVRAVLDERLKAFHEVPKPIFTDIMLGKPQTITVTLKPGSYTKLILTEAKTGKPIADARVYLYRHNPRTKFHEGIGLPYSNAKGIAPMRKEADRYKLDIHSKTHRLPRTGQPHYITITRRPNESHSITLVPLDMITIKGLAVNAEGRPLGGALIDSYGFRLVVHKDRETRADGTFVLKGELETKADAHPAYMRLLHPKSGLALRMPIPKKSKDIRLTLLPASILTGSIHDLDGKPVVGAHLTVSSVLKHNRKYDFGSYRLTPVTGITDNRGQFRLACFESGAKIQMRMRHGGYDRIKKIIKVRSAARPGAEQSIGKIVVSRLDRKVRCTVVDENGKPVGGASGLIYTPNGMSTRVMANKAGKFSVTTARGKLHLRMSSTNPRRLSSETTVKAGVNDVLLVVSPRGGYVKPGTPIPSATKEKIAASFKAWVKGRPEAGKKAVFLCFFSDQTPDSLLAVKKLAALAPSYSKEKLAIVALAFTSATDAQIAEWARIKAPGLTVLKGGAPKDWSKAWGLSGLPCMALFDKAGSLQVISHNYTGVLDQLEAYGQ